MKRVSFFLLAALLLPLSMVTAQTSPWSEPVTFPQNGWFPAIIADASGGVHLFWSHSLYFGVDPNNPDIPPAAGYDVVYYTSSPNGDQWQPVNDILAIPQYQVRSVEVTRPMPWIDSYDTLHLTFRNLDVFYSQAPLLLAAQAKAWRPYVPLTPQNLGYFSNLIGDSNGRLHVVYTENHPDEQCTLCYHLFYRYSDDQGVTWSVPIDLSKLAAQPVGAAKPQLLLDEQENLHVLWEAGTGGTFGGVNEPVQILHAVSFDGGTTWKTLHQITPTNGPNASNPALAMDRMRRLMVVWLNTEEDVPYYRLSVTHGRSWEAPQRIPQVWGERRVHDTRQSAFSLVRDSAGQIHLLMIGRLEETEAHLSVLHLTWDGQHWSPPEVVATYEKDVPEWPQAAIGLGNRLHVTWFVRPAAHIWDANPNFYTIWYTRRSLGAPALNARPLFSPPPTPTSTPPDRVTPTPTPPPALQVQPVVPGQVHTIFSENDDLLVIAISLLPTFVLFAGLMLYTRRRYRL
ncbi:MAG: exo-alpha-sialidase [Anaerolineales bacterium]